MAKLTIHMHFRILSLGREAVAQFGLENMNEQPRTPGKRYLKPFFPTVFPPDTVLSRALKGRNNKAQAIGLGLDSRPNFHP